MFSTTSRRTLVAGGIALALSLPLAAPAVAKAPSGSYRSGKTSQGLKSTGSVSGGKVKKLTVAYSSKCADGTFFNSPGFKFNPIPLNGRKFKIEGTDSDRLEDGSIYVQDISVRGTFNKKGTKASGTVRFDTRIRTATGVLNCTTGKVTFKLAR